MHDNPPVTMIISIVTMVRYIQRKHVTKRNTSSLFLSSDKKIGIISVLSGK